MSRNGMNTNHTSMTSREIGHPHNQRLEWLWPAEIERGVIHSFLGVICGSGQLRGHPDKESVGSSCQTLLFRNTFVHRHAALRKNVQRVWRVRFWMLLFFLDSSQKSELEWRWHLSTTQYHAHVDCAPPVPFSANDSLSSVKEGLASFSTFSVSFIQTLIRESLFNQCMI